MRRPTEAKQCLFVHHTQREDNSQVCLCSIRECKVYASEAAEKRNEAFGLIAEFRASIGVRASWLPRVVHGNLPPPDALI